MQRFALPLALLFAAACADAGGTRAAETPRVDSALRPGAPAAAGEPSPPPLTAGRWRTNPEAGVTLTPGPPLLVETGPHTLLWQADAGDLAPPYTVRAEMRKRAGRLHEGYGIIFGGTGLEGAEDAQEYSYFLVRGDGSFLIKRRQGAETPLVRDWTRHPRINRDAEGTGRPNRLEVRVGADSAAFLVNGVEVARVASAELAVRGRPGLRIAHDVAVEVMDFAAGADSVAP